MYHSVRSVHKCSVKQMFPIVEDLPPPRPGASHFHFEKAPVNCLRLCLPTILVFCYFTIAPSSYENTFINTCPSFLSNLRYSMNSVSKPSAAFSPLSLWSYNNTPLTMPFNTLSLLSSDILKSLDPLNNTMYYFLLPFCLELPLSPQTSA